MKLLDLFCGAGGAAMGYWRAGFHDITGIDHEPQKNYPFDFQQADVFEWCAKNDLSQYDLIHASPPCQGFSVAGHVHRNKGKKYIDCLTPIRAMLPAIGVPYVIENVIGAPMNGTIVLCGLMFDLKVFRHRIFECSQLIMSPEHPSHKGKRIGEGYFSVAGGAGRWKSWGTVHRNISKGAAAEWREAMGIDWMTRSELKDAIPPAYTEWIGKQILCSK